MVGFCRLVQGIIEKITMEVSVSEKVIVIIICELMNWWVLVRSLWNLLEVLAEFLGVIGGVQVSTVGLLMWHKCSAGSSVDEAFQGTSVYWWDLSEAVWRSVSSEMLIKYWWISSRCRGSNERLNCWIIDAVLVDYYWSTGKLLMVLGKLWHGL